VPTLAGDAVDLAPVGPGGGIPNGYTRSLWPTSVGEAWVRFAKQHDA